MRSSASRNSGKVSHDQSMPLRNTDDGMSSTLSIISMSQSRRSGAHGAKPTEQLPITTVVTPCQHDGERSPSQNAWPS